MVTNVAPRRVPPALALLLWCALGTALVQFALARWAANPGGFSASFWYLLNAYDTHGNLVLAAIAVLAFLLRREPAALVAVRFAGEHPWPVAGAAFMLLGAGALTAYHDYPLSMDEYAALFQAQVFASGHLSGRLPPPLQDYLIPTFFQSLFFTISRASGEVASGYWPGFALLVAPFAWLGIPWAANPLIGALSLPALHRLTRELTGSKQAAGWAVLLCAASPAFVVSAISYYAMPAHLLCNLLYALLLLRATPKRALLAGLVGGLALTLHNPLPHLLFALPFIVCLAARREFASLGTLAAGYLPLALLLGIGWQHFLAAMLMAQAKASTPEVAAAIAKAIPSVPDKAWGFMSSAMRLPTAAMLEARIAGLSKIWTWGSAGLMVLAAWGYAAARARTEVKLLGAALALTFFGYFLVRFDQGHGWGYRYLHSAWFVLPLLGAIALTRPADEERHELVQMACWATLLSLVAAVGLRLAQVDAFIGQHLAQVPPLTRSADRTRPEVVFMDIRKGFYVQDMVHNDPFLRAPRILLVYRGPAEAEALMTAHFPGYRRETTGAWGEHWLKPPP